MLPRVLVIDDQFGRFPDARRDLCALFGLRDTTGDDPSAEAIANPLAEAMFTTSQVTAGGEAVNSIKAATAAIRAGWPFDGGARWALVLLDLRFVSGMLDSSGHPEGHVGDDAFGLKILKAIRAEAPELPVVILSSRERAEVIEDCRKLGAADFIQRLAPAGGPYPRDLLAAKLREYGLLEDDRGIIVGRSLALLQTLAAARRAATGGGNILLLGESGTGKELAARYIHDHSPKARGPYKIFHAFGTAETLQEDQLFGHAKGAFTDAKSDRPGFFELASGGTLFIDEVGDIPATLQNRLLRPIETRRVTRQGDEREIVVDVQLVLATNKALNEYVATGRFKFDLLNRVRAYPITLPQLHERREDIPLLTVHLLELLCREHGARWPRTVHPGAMAALVAHDWRDGNVRELRNVLERVVKDNKDAEIVVEGDIRFDALWVPSTRVEGEAKPGAVRPRRGSRDGLEAIRDLPAEYGYAALHGAWPTVQREIAQLLARYLVAAIEATRKHRPGGPLEGEINLTGAASCLLGRQVPTVKAADFIKRLLQFDESVQNEIFQEHPVLKETLDAALRHRPSRTKAPPAKIRGAR